MTRHQVWYLDQRAISARRVQIVEHLGLRGTGAFIGDFMGDSTTAKPLWQALSSKKPTHRGQFVLKTDERATTQHV